jgi:hypothetical protein
MPANVAHDMLPWAVLALFAGVVVASLVVDALVALSA